MRKERSVIFACRPLLGENFHSCEKILHTRAYHCGIPALLLPHMPEHPSTYTCGGKHPFYSHRHTFAVLISEQSHQLDILTLSHFLADNFCQHLSSVLFRGLFSTRRSTVRVQGGIRGTSPVRCQPSVTCVHVPTSTLNRLYLCVFVKGHESGQTSSSSSSKRSEREIAPLTEVHARTLFFQDVQTINCYGFDR